MLPGWESSTIRVYSVTTQTDFFTAICWQFCWQVEWTLVCGRQKSLRPKSILDANTFEHLMKATALPLIAVAALAGVVANHHTHGDRDEYDRTIR